MAEQKIDLDEAIELFKKLENYEEYREGLREVLKLCKTNEEVEKAKNAIMEHKKYLEETNPEFKAIMDQRKQDIKVQRDLEQAIHKAQMAEEKAKAATAKADAMSKARSAMSDPELEEWVAKTRFKIVDQKELEKKSEENLWCPICRKKDTSNNIVNNYPTCMIDMHRLVPKSELKNYPRSYRRAWKRGKKRK